MSKVVAVIDIGSNSARMAIFKRTSRFGFHLLLETKSKVRISQGSYENGGILQVEPMQRALSALKDFAQIAKNYHATKILCVATSAIRDAPNKQEFIAKARKEAKIHIKVIDGKQEAFFGAVACSNLLHKKSGVTIDIGGGSTECAIIENGKIRDLISLDIGTIRLKELFFDEKQNANKKPNIAGAKKFIKAELEKIPQSFQNKIVFGIGGSIRALSKLIQGKYPLNLLHGYEFSVSKNLSLFERIYKSEISELGALGVPSERWDNIRGGAMIFAMILEYLGAKSVLTSGVGVREGVFLADLLRNQNYTFPHNFNPSYRSISDRFISDTKAQNLIRTNASRLFSAMGVALGISEKYRFHLENAAGLVRVGEMLSPYMAHEHSAYFLLNALSYGYSHNDRAIICLLVKYSKKKIPKDDEIVAELAESADISAIQWLSYMLSIAECVLGRIIECDFSGELLKIKCDKSSYIANERVATLQAPKKICVKFV